MQMSGQRDLYQKKKNIAKQQIRNVINHLKTETEDKADIFSRLMHWPFSFGKISDYFDEDEIRNLI
jgi:hypothetical protein